MRLKCAQPANLHILGVTNKQLDGVVAFYPTSCAPSSDLAMLLYGLLVEIPLRTSVTIVGVVCKLFILHLFIFVF